MKKQTKALLYILTITLVVTAIAAFIWITTTTSGTLWLLKTAFPLSGISFSAQKIEGTISNHLHLTGVRVTMGQQKAEIDSLELRWKPALLMAGTIAIQELIIKEIRVQDDAPPDDKPPVLSWPKASGKAQLFDGRIARLLVTNLSYRHLQEQPVLVTSLKGTVTWQNSTLFLTDLKATSPTANINGSVSAGFNRPSLTSDLTVALTRPLAKMDQFSLQIRPGTGPEQFVGSVAISGSAGTRKLLELSGNLGMAKDAINLRKLSLIRPGQKGLLTADGSLALSAKESLLALKVTAAGLDLAPELNVPTNLSGTLKFAGTLDSYTGEVSLDNQAQGWQAANVTASYQGNRQGLKLAPLKGSIIDGSLAGNLKMDWCNGFAMQAVINGRNLNPSRIDPAWKGIANFNANGNLAWSDKSPLTGSVSGILLESRLHGQALTGELQADFAENNLLLAKLLLQGKGFKLHASGELNQRITLAAQISDFSLLIPGSSGTLQAEGWLRWRDRQLNGAINGTGSRLAYAGTKIAAANLNIQLEQGVGYPLHVNAALRDVIYDAYKLDAVTLDANGTLPRHTVNATLRSGGSEARLTLNAGYNASIWKGDINKLTGSDRNGPWKIAAPAAFLLSTEKFTLAPLTLTAGATERLEASADLSLNPLTGQLRTHWTGLNLARANAYLKDMRMSGSSSGTARIGILANKQLSLTGNASGSGTFTGKAGSLTVQRSRLTLDGSELGLRLGVDLTTADNGTLKGTFSSTTPLLLAMPEQGDLMMELQGLDLALLKPWLPTDTRLAGHISGRATGRLLTGKRFELDGNSVLSGGTWHQERPDGELKLAFTSATASWGWRGETLSGNLALAMTQYGQVRGTFQLPLAARLPLSFNPKGPLRGSLVGQVQEKGLITTLFPGLVQESSGQLDLDLAISGTWETPQTGGKLLLSKAGAYLPTAGIHLKELQLAARLEKNLIRIDSMRAVSGAGHIDVTALITLAGWKMTNYQGTISGENFQTVHFPELQIVSTPKLSFEGTPQKLKLRGDLRLPELNIVGTQSRTTVSPSSDVIREGSVVPVEKTSPLAMDVQVRVLLGDKVFIKTSGINAQLGGAMDLAFSSLDRITSAGEIKVVKGSYRTYGVNLEIVRGRLFFAGGAVNRPALDFLALRTIGNIRAGVTVTGTLQRPITKLYSEPAMPDVDVLAYIVLGHPLGSSGEQASLVTQAARALLTSKQAALMQEKIKNHLGLSTLEIQRDVGGSTSPMGYKALQVTAPGALPADQQSGITETVLTVGKYLTPQLYISYGKSLFTGSNLFRLRYDIFKNWQIETQTGSGESGADLYYKMEFK